MRIQYSYARSRAVRLLVAAVGALALGVFALPPGAAAEVARILARFGIGISFGYAELTVEDEEVRGLVAQGVVGRALEDAARVLVGHHGDNPDQTGEVVVVLQGLRGGLGKYVTWP